MALRRHHVRRAVLAALFLLVFVPLATFAAWVAWLRHEGAGRLERRLAAILSAGTGHVRIEGLELASPSEARIEELSVAWPTGRGNVGLLLRDVSAETDEDRKWRVSAAAGRFDVRTDDLAETLGVLDQRLVQPDGDVPLGDLTVGRMDLAVESPRLRVTRSGGLDVAAGKAAGAWLAVWKDGTPPRGAIPHGVPPRYVGAKLDVGSPAGVFTMVRIEAADLRVTDVLTALGRSPVAVDPAGTVKVLYVWRRDGETKDPPDSFGPGRFNVEATGLKLAEWTADLPGGPITGTVDVSFVERSVPEGKPPASLDFKATDGGMIHTETLAWLGQLVPPAAALPYPYVGRIGYDGLEARVTFTSDGRARLVPSAGGAEAPAALITTTLFGQPVPLVVAGSEPFDPGPVWDVLTGELLREEESLRAEVGSGRPRPRTTRPQNPVETASPAR